MKEDKNEIAEKKINFLKQLHPEAEKHGVKVTDYDGRFAVYLEKDGEKSLVEISRYGSYYRNREYRYRGTFGYYSARQWKNPKSVIKAFLEAVPAMKRNREERKEREAYRTKEQESQESNVKEFAKFLDGTGIECSQQSWSTYFKGEDSTVEISPNGSSFKLSGNVTLEMAKKIAALFENS